MSWIQTYTGRQFFPLKPSSSDVHIRDIAHALSLQCRFTGHTRTFYSVAEHSVRVSWLLEKWGEGPLTQLHGLLHDAGEAYIGDMARPLKANMPWFKATESDVFLAVATKFGLLLKDKMPEVIKHADNVLLATEARDLLGPAIDNWVGELPPPLVDPVIPWTWEESKARFYDRFCELFL